MGRSGISMSGRIFNRTVQIWRYADVVGNSAMGDAFSETTAVMTRVRENLRFGYKKKDIRIYKDSRAALKALDRRGGGSLLGLWTCCG